jgi:hypothetical protein
LGGVEETRQVVIGPGHHEVCIDWNAGDCSGSVHEGGTEGDVVHEMAVHDVQMQPVGACIFDALNFLMKPAEVTGEERGGYEYGVHLKRKRGRPEKPMAGVSRRSYKKRRLNAKNVARRGWDALQNTSRGGAIPE